MAKRGARRTVKNLPKGIDPGKLPDGCYWDASGRGHWYTFYYDSTGSRRRTRIAGPDATLSDLHKIMEDRQGAMRDTFAYISDLFHKSDKYLALAVGTRKDYDYCWDVVISHPTKIGIPLGDAPLGKWSQPMMQRLVDTLAKERGPSAANHVLRYARRVFAWAMNRGHAAANPAKGVEAAKERRQRRLPSPETYIKVLKFAYAHAAPYLWIVMELAYLLRMRGIEVITLTDAHETPEGVLVERRKGSRGNITEWTPRLKAAWDAAKALRAEKKQGTPTPIKPGDRWLFPASDGEHLRRSSLDSAWQRMVTEAIDKGVIATEDRFSIHDLKRAGISRTQGTRADKREASGHRTDSMMDVYDLSLPVVQPTEE